MFQNGATIMRPSSRAGDEATQERREGRLAALGLLRCARNDDLGTIERTLQVITLGAARPVRSRMPAMASAAAMSGASTACVSPDGLAGSGS